MSKSVSNIPARILHYRILYGLTQEQLARDIDMNKTQLSHYESGERVPTVHNLLRLAEGLDVKIDDLLK